MYGGPESSTQDSIPPNVPQKNQVICLTHVPSDDIEGMSYMTPLQPATKVKDKSIIIIRSINTETAGVSKIKLSLSMAPNSVVR